MNNNMPVYLPIMLALCLALLVTYCAFNYAGIIVRFKRCDRARIVFTFEHFVIINKSCVISSTCWLPARPSPARRIAINRI